MSVAAARTQVVYGQQPWHELCQFGAGVCQVRLGGSRENSCVRWMICSAELTEEGEIVEDSGEAVLYPPSDNYRGCPRQSDIGTSCPELCRTQHSWACSEECVTMTPEVTPGLMVNRIVGLTAALALKPKRLHSGSLHLVFIFCSLFFTSLVACTYCFYLRANTRSEGRIIALYLALCQCNFHFSPCTHGTRAAAGCAARPPAAAARRRGARGPAGAA